MKHGRFRGAGTLRVKEFSDLILKLKFHFWFGSCPQNFAVPLSPMNYPVSLLGTWLKTQNSYKL